MKICANCKYFNTCGDLERVADCNGKVVGIPDAIKFADIVTIAKAHMKPEDIDHHESDLYLRYNDVSAKILAHVEGTRPHVKTFISAIEPHVLWFEIWWAYHEEKGGE